ncbi:MAG: MFS transporter, partial [Pseudomonadota bacterium]
MTPLRDRLYYSAGGAVYATKEAAYNIFILLYYTQVLGLNGALTGTVIACGLAWDAISDPLVGTWSDRLKTRFGRRFPLLVASILPLGIGYLGLFTPPASILDDTFLLAGWLLFWSLWVRTFITSYAI